MNVFKNDKLMLINEFEGMKTIGEVYEVANIINDTTVVLRNSNTKVAVAAIDIEYIDKYFKKFDDSKAWTNWSGIIDTDGNLIMNYRTNGRKVQIRSADGCYQSEASCCKHDSFNLAFGIKLAYLRCMNKMMKDIAAEHEMQLKTLNSHITENKNNIKRLIRTLDDAEDDNVNDNVTE